MITVNLVRSIERPALNVETAHDPNAMKTNYVTMISENARSMHQ